MKALLIYLSDNLMFLTFWASIFLIIIILMFDLQIIDIVLKIEGALLIKWLIYKLCVFFFKNEHD